ncbi:protein phosphatase 2C domain-containing protein [Actinoplanes derwentensis]|uniref:Serine/threonine protein phosphatase PrpC n=1 Tax=Actinoplanes derwentensis TaxID=113562 RepID=A0A1H2AWI7_9ACTN|nr:protein phosphatase 2C domain-containing protein [Actinoplanes derwentensis]SDT50348.1 Serine/threonine protein phosphatase PrpC [Actinoplanes derwentensis]
MTEAPPTAQQDDTSLTTDDWPGEPLVLVGNPRLGSTPRSFPTAPESPPDSMIDGHEVADLVVRAASLRGDDHRWYGEPRQDSFAVHKLSTPGGEALLCCVADGVGSKPLSHIGSAALCRLLGPVIAPYAADLLDPEQEGMLRTRLASLITEVSKLLGKKADEYREQPSALSTTLVAALFGPVTGGRRQAVLFAVGDSPAFVLRDGMIEEPFGAEDPVELAGGATAALPASVGEVTASVAELAAGDVVVLCTDGLGNPMKNTGVSDKILAWWQGSPPNMAEFYWQLSFRAQSFGDDRTAVCVWVR